MTKFVLNSGGIGNNPEGGKRYFVELVKGLGTQPRMLICHFAQQREVWEEKFIAYTQSFVKLMPDGVKPHFEMALPGIFTEQVGKSDVIYFHGGDDHLAMYWMDRLKIEEVCKGRVVGTNSATTHALSAHFWTCDWRGLHNGLGVLPIKTIAHYYSDYGLTDPRGPINWAVAKNNLEEFGDKDLPVYALPEGEFIVIEK